MLFKGRLVSMCQFHITIATQEHQLEGTCCLGRTLLVLLMEDDGAEMSWNFHGISGPRSSLNHSVL